MYKHALPFLTPPRFVRRPSGFGSEPSGSLPAIPSVTSIASSDASPPTVRESSLHSLLSAQATPGGAASGLSPPSGIFAPAPAPSSSSRPSAKTPRRYIGGAGIPAGGAEPAPALMDDTSFRGGAHNAQNVAQNEAQNGGHNGQNGKEVTVGSKSVKARRFAGAVNAFEVLGGAAVGALLDEMNPNGAGSKSVKVRISAEIAYIYIYILYIIIYTHTHIYRGVAR